MKRGGTPTYKFSTPVSATSIDTVEIAFVQGSVYLLKSTPNVEIGENLISVTLSQEDTMRFFNGQQSVKVQIRIKTVDGKILISDIFKIQVSESLFKEAL